MAEKKKAKKAKKTGMFEITKLNGKKIYRKNLGDYVEVYKAKGCKVKEI